MSEVSSAALERARRVRLMIFDVDGVLTDGRLWYGPTGEALKAFHTLDGHGIKMLAQSGVAPAILSGRRSEAVAQRADGATGSVLKAMCTEAGMFAIREDRDSVTTADFELAVDKVMGENRIRHETASGAMYA